MITQRSARLFRNTIFQSFCIGLMLVAMFGLVFALLGGGNADAPAARPVAATDVDDDVRRATASTVRWMLLQEEPGVYPLADIPFIDVSAENPTGFSGYDGCNQMSAALATVDDGDLSRSTFVVSSFESDLQYCPDHVSWIDPLIDGQVALVIERVSATFTGSNTTTRFERLEELSVASINQLQGVWTLDAGSSAVIRIDVSASRISIGDCSADFTYDAGQFGFREGDDVRRILSACYDDDASSPVASFAAALHIGATVHVDHDSLVLLAPGRLIRLGPV